MSENITIRDGIYKILKEMKPEEEKVSFSDVIQNLLDENERQKREIIRLTEEKTIEKGKSFLGGIGNKIINRG